MFNLSLALAQSQRLACQLLRQLSAPLQKHNCHKCSRLALVFQTPRHILGISLSCFSFQLSRILLSMCFRSPFSSTWIVPCVHCSPLIVHHQDVNSMSAINPKNASIVYLQTLLFGVTGGSATESFWPASAPDQQLRATQNAAGISSHIKFPLLLSCLHIPTSRLLECPMNR